jgi:hypothetical protein
MALTGGRGGEGGVTSNVLILTQTLWYGNFFDFYKFYTSLYLLTFM